jgi:FAD/FMN-containing dehydrogenase
MDHDEKVARIVRDVRARVAPLGGGRAERCVSLGKETVSHFVPNPRDRRHTDPKIDVRGMTDILEIDVAGRTCTAEPGVTFSELVRALLPHGLAPKLVPELETITIGGAVAGCAVESMSHKYGGFHDSCLEYEVVTGRGDVVRCSPERDGELFEMIHGSYGTLGIITKLKFALIPAKPFVHIEYRLFESAEAFRAEMFEQCAAPDVDFVDAIVHSPTRFVLCLGRFVDSAPRTSSYTGLEVYYRSTLALREDFLATYDYFFRYDTDCHWTSRTIPGMHSRLGRWLLGGFILGSTNMLKWSQRFRPLFKLQKRLPVVIDLFIPRRSFATFYDWYAESIGYYPLWLVPYRMPAPYRWIAKDHLGDAAKDLFVDVAIYGLPNDRPGVDYSKLLEDRTRELGGIKTLISENHYDEATFWSVYARAQYEQVKRRMDPHGLFRDVYEKFHPRDARPAAEPCAQERPGDLGAREPVVGGFGPA